MEALDPAWQSLARKSYFYSPSPPTCCFIFLAPLSSSWRPLHFSRPPLQRAPATSSPFLACLRRRRLRRGPRSRAMLRWRRSRRTWQRRSGLPRGATAPLCRRAERSGVMSVRRTMQRRAGMPQPRRDAQHSEAASGYYATTVRSRSPLVIGILHGSHGSGPAIHVQNFIRISISIC
jgi:hypothetical protein